MAKKEKKISINKLESTLVDPVITVAFTEEENITVRRYLTLQQTLQFVDDVVSSVVNTETGSYLPEVYDLAIRRAVLTYFANFNLPDNIEKLHELVYNTRAYKIVTNEIDDLYFAEIERAINSKIKFNIEMMHSTAARETNELIQMLKDVSENFQAVFGNADPESVSALVNGLGSVGQLDEKKIAHAVLDYAKASSENKNADGGETE